MNVQNVYGAVGFSESLVFSLMLKNEVCTRHASFCMERSS
jgi:hypothetical protein